MNKSNAGNMYLRLVDSISTQFDRFFLWFNKKDNLWFKSFVFTCSIVFFVIAYLAPTNAKSESFSIKGFSQLVCGSFFLLGFYSIILNTSPDANKRRLSFISGLTVLFLAPVLFNIAFTIYKYPFKWGYFDNLGNALLFVVIICIFLLALFYQCHCFTQACKAKKNVFKSVLGLILPFFPNVIIPIIDHFTGK